MEKEEFQKKYNNSILVCCTEASIKKVLNICYLMDLTASKSKQITAILIGEQTAKSPLFHVEQFLSDFYKGIEEGERKETKMFEQRMNNAIYKLKHKYGDTYIIKGTDGFGNKERVMIDKDDFYVFRKAVRLLYICNKWVTKDNEKQSKEPDFKKGNKIMYTIKDSNGNTYPVRRLSERVYESKEHKTLFITDEEGVVTGIYKEK